MKLKMTKNSFCDGNPIQEGNYKQRYIISGKLESIARLKDALILTKALPGIVVFNFPIL